MTAKEQLQELFKAATKRAIQIDSQLFLFVGDGLDPRIDCKIRRALAAGKTVVENGVSQWIELIPITDHSKEGCDVYTWKDGNTVRAERVLFTRKADDTLERKSLGLAWVNWSKVFGD